MEWLVQNIVATYTSTVRACLLCGCRYLQGTRHTHRLSPAHVHHMQSQMHIYSCTYSWPECSGLRWGACCWSQVQMTYMGIGMCALLFPPMWDRLHGCQWIQDFSQYWMSCKGAIQFWDTSPAATTWIKIFLRPNICRGPARLCRVVVLTAYTRSLRMLSTIQPPSPPSSSTSLTLRSNPSPQEDSRIHTSHECM